MHSERSDFSFSLLEAEVSKYSPDVPVFDAVGREKWLFAIGLAGAAVATVAVLNPSLSVRFPLIVGGAIAEAVGLVSGLVLKMSREWKALRVGKAFFAEELDSGHARYRQLIAWLRSHPSASLRESLVYVRRRGEGMKRKLGLLSGGVERLGILPLVVAVFLQVRSFTWPGTVSYLGLVAAVVLALLYFMSWLSVLTTLRLDTYEAALSDALNDDA